MTFLELIFFNKTITKLNQLYDRKLFLISLLTHDSAGLIETLELFFKWQLFAA